MNAHDEWRMEPVYRLHFLHLVDDLDSLSFRKHFAKWLSDLNTDTAIHDCFEFEPEGELKRIRDRHFGELLDHLSPKERKAYLGKRDDSFWKRKEVRVAKESSRWRLDYHQKLINRLARLTPDRQIDYLNDHLRKLRGAASGGTVGWDDSPPLVKDSGNLFVYPASVEFEYYDYLQRSGALPHERLLHKSLEAEFARNVVFKFIKMDKTLSSLEDCWRKCHSARWSSPSFSVASIVEDVMRGKLELEHVPPRLAKLIERHRNTLQKENSSWRLEHFLGHRWPDLKKLFLVGGPGNDGWSLDCEITEAVQGNGASSLKRNVETVRKRRENLGLRFKLKPSKK